MSLKSIDEHNKEKAAERAELERKLRSTGVACPNCGEELIWPMAFSQALVWPPPSTKPARCKACNLIVELET